MMRILCCLSIVVAMVYGRSVDGDQAVGSGMRQTASNPGHWRSNRPTNLSNGNGGVNRRLKKGGKGGKKSKGSKGKKHQKSNGGDSEEKEKLPLKKGDDDDDSDPTMSPTYPPPVMPVAPVAIPIQSPVASPPTGLPVSSTPAPNVMPVAAATETNPPTDDFYRIISCGNAEEIVSVEVSYVYMVHVAESFDIEFAIDAVTAIEEDNLNAVVEDLLPCSGPERRTRRRLDTAVLGASALPKDEPSGLCGDDCTVVNGGMTIFVVDEGDSDYTLLQCEVLAIVRDSMIRIESDEEGIDEIDLVNDDFDCGGLLDKSIPGVFNSNAESGSGTGPGTPIAAMAAIAVGTALIALLALLLVRRRKRSDESTCSFLGFDKDGDMSSIMTPETGETPGRLSPDRRSPTGLLDSPDRSVGSGSPIAQFDPDALDKTNQAGNNNVNAGSPTSGPSGVAASILGFEDYQTDQKIVGRDGNGDFLYDNSDNEATVNLVMANSDYASNDVPLLSPTMQTWQKQTPSPGTSLILSSIPEVGDDASVETAEIANTSRNSNQ